MKRIFPFLLLITLTLASCNYINTRILKHTIRGVYANSKGEKLEFTETKVSMDYLGTYNYKLEDKYLFIEKVSFGELPMSDIKFEIINPSTIKLRSGGFLSKIDENDPQITFKKIEE